MFIHRSSVNFESFALARVRRLRMVRPVTPQMVAAVRLAGSSDSSVYPMMRQRMTASRSSGGKVLIAWKKLVQEKAVLLCAA